MGDPATTEAVRQAYEDARRRLESARNHVIDHENEINAHHPDGSVDYPYADGPWDAEAEAADLAQEKQELVDAQRAFDVARDDYRRVDPEAFAATAKADLAATERAYTARNADLDRLKQKDDSYLEFWEGDPIRRDLEHLQAQLEVDRASVASAGHSDALVFDQPQEPGVDTGHYDDGHSFGWNKTPPPLDTGHYDDGHAFGWGTGKKAAVAVGIVAAILGIVAGAIALTRGDSKKTTQGTDSGRTPPVVIESSSSSSSSSLDVVSLPANTVLDGCIAIDPQGNTTVLHEGFVLADPQSGTYTAQFAKGPTGAVRGTGTANGNLVVTDVRISAFGVYDGLTLTQPDGTPIALGPLQSQLPLDINAQTDKPNGCDPSTLKLPVARSAEADHTAITSFLPEFAHAMQVADVSFLVNALDPAVIARYGAPQCTADVSSIPPDQTANFVLKSFVGGPEPFTYASDGQSTVVQNTYEVAVSRTADASTTDSTLHLSVDAGGAVHWFTDCTH